LRQDIARKLSGSPSYDIEKIKAVLSKIKDRVKIIIAPVFMQGLNNDDIEDLIKYCKENKFELLIQNFMFNKQGRKPVKEMDIDVFSNI